MAAPPTEHEILDVNRRYHDVAAAEYDAKWGISFGESGQQQVLGKVAKLLGSPPGPFGRSLEIGAGTGYFSLNMLQAGTVERAVCTDISPGMLATLEGNARRLGVPVETVACDATRLPFEDASFDLVFGHAVLHHLPALDRSFAEFHRVLRPGGRLIILEFSLPTNPVLRGLYNFYFRKILPRTATLISGDKTGAYKYLPESVNTFIGRPQMVDMLTTAGFSQVEQFPMTFGVCVCYRGIKH